MTNRILVIDDNPAIHDDIRKILGKGGDADSALDAAEALLLGGSTPEDRRIDFEIDSAFQGQEGLEKLRAALARQSPYALAFVDVRMPPGWDGIETISRLWEVSPELQVVICTAYSDYSWDDIAHKIGRSDSLLILKKPFDNIEVLQMAHALVKKWVLTLEAKARLETLDHEVNLRTRELQVANQRLVQEMEERGRAEHQLRQAQKMEAIGHLAAGVAHDFRNILTVIQGHASLQRMAPHIDPRLADSLGQIEEAVERASKLTRQLLAFGRKQILQLEVINLNSLVEHLSRMLARLIGEQVTLRCQYAKVIPLIEADVCNIEQVIINLAVNARDAMPDGGTLEITTAIFEVDTHYAAGHPDAQPGRYVCLTVRDTGCGMDESTRQRLFEPFFTTKEVGKGTGMGLATAYGIVKQLKGWIEVKSAPGEGATFSVFLPATTKGLSAPENNDASQPALGGGETILVVEDEAPVRDFVTELLRRYGYQVRIASNGTEALQEWQHASGRVDLLLTDVVMPQQISGLDLAERLLSEKNDLKVIYTSGYSVELFDRRFKQSPQVRFLAKPYHPLKLAETVRGCLDS